MRLASAALALALLSAAPAAAQALGSPAPATPYDVDRFNGPSTGDVPVDTFLEPHRTALERLRLVCSSSLLRDRNTCSRAWREINAAHAQLQAARQAGSATPN